MYSLSIHILLHSTTQFTLYVVLQVILIRLLLFELASAVLAYMDIGSVGLQVSLELLFSRASHATMRAYMGF